MSVLWCGGEDLDFQQGTLPTVDTTSGRFRTGYARCGLDAVVGSAINPCKGNQFSGGAVTSAWLTCRVYAQARSSSRYCQNMCGFGLLSGVTGLTVGNSTANPNKATLYTYNAGTFTALASESGNSLLASTLQRIDMQVSSYGATATVNVYVDGVLVITFSGDVRVGGMTNVDCVIFGPISSGASALDNVLSEVIVADEDTRLFSLVTMAPNAAGDTDAWTGAYTDCNPITINDANAVYTNTTGQDEEFNLTDLPGGTFTIRAVKVSARASMSAGATATKLKLGYKTNSSLDVGTSQSLSTAWACYERLDQQNPVTSNDWQQSEMNPLQVALESAS